MDKRVLSLLLTFAMLASLFSGTSLLASAQDDQGSVRAALASGSSVGEGQSATTDTSEDIDVYFIDGTDTQAPSIFFYNSAEYPNASSEDLGYPGTPEIETLGLEMNGHNYYMVTLDPSSVDRIMFGNSAGSFSTGATGNHTAALSFISDVLTHNGQKYVVYSVKQTNGSMTTTVANDVWPVDSKQVTKEPTCTEKGVEAYVGLITGAASSGKEIPALGHNYSDVVTPPTCTEKGYTTHTCSRCNDVKKDSYTNALGHNWSSWTQTVAPTCTKTGTKTRKCSRCSTEESQELSALGHSWDSGVVTVEPKYQAPGEKKFTCTRCGNVKTETIPKKENPFLDVKSSDFFFNPVLWALDETVTSGTDDTHFSPNQTVMRCDAMLFFYAAKGRPGYTTTENPFKDVKKKHWYYNAVMWAVENEITSGTDPTHFSPKQTCSRSEILQFLYAAMGKPGFTIANPYSDVKKSQWYYSGAIWAYEKGLERGTNGKFKAKTPCTRGYVVTYLYRFITGKELAT